LNELRDQLGVLQAEEYLRLRRVRLQRDRLLFLGEQTVQLRQRRLSAGSAYGVEKLGGRISECHVRHYAGFHGWLANL